MFDIGWAEAGVIMLIALIVIGPKDLPKVARTLGKWTRKARAMASEFQRSLDDMAREAELEEVKKGFDAARSARVGSLVEKAVDSDGSLKKAFSIGGPAKASGAAGAASTGEATSSNAGGSRAAGASPGAASPTASSTTERAQSTIAPSAATETAPTPAPDPAPSADPTPIAAPSPSAKPTSSGGGAPASGA